MARWVRIRWPELDTAIRMEIEEKNSNLGDEIWEALPFSCVQDHGVVTGKIMYCWVPLVSTAPIHFAAWHSQAPIGRVFYSQGTGNKIIINYGVATEDIDAPVLAVVAKEDLAKLEPVGRRAWESCYITKDIIEVIFEKGES